MKGKRKLRPITGKIPALDPVQWSDVKAGRYDSAPYICSAFLGCWQYCAYDLSNLPCSNQATVFLAALDAEPKGEEICQLAAARAFADMCQAYGWVSDMNIQWDKLKQV